MIPRRQNVFVMLLEAKACSVALRKSVGVGVLLLLAVCGCKSTGEHIANGGQNVGRFGDCALIVSGINPLLMPLGIAFWIPCETVAYPMYYGGKAVAREHPDEHPFEP